MMKEMQKLIKEYRRTNHRGLSRHTQQAGYITAFTTLYKVDQKSVAHSRAFICKDLLDDIALLCQRTKPSNREAVKLKDLPTLVWQIINHPNPSAKIA